MRWIFPEPAGLRIHRDSVAISVVGMMMKSGRISERHLTDSSESSPFSGCRVGAREPVELAYFSYVVGRLMRSSLAMKN